MKKGILYITIGLLLLLLLFLLLGNGKKGFDHRVTLNKNEKIPYGTWVAYNSLNNIFPKATVKINKKEPGYWDYEVVDPDSANQVLMIVTKDFNAYSSELTELFNFVSKGNDVFISAHEFSLEFNNFFHLYYTLNDYSIGAQDFTSFDTLELSLSKAPFINGPNDFGYPGKRFNSYFQDIDTSMSYILGRTEDKKVTCIKIKAGEGYFILHAAPLAFSNYFLLYQNNIEYYNQLLSALNPHAKAVIWDEFYLHKIQNYSDNDKSPFRILLSQPSFKMALYTALAGLFIFVLLGIKRKERIYPAQKPPANDSLDFVKTIGRLYYQKGDNTNISQKMAGHFIEYIHTRYHIATDKLDDDFAERLAQKSGAAKEPVLTIVSYINYLKEGNIFSNEQVADFYKLLDQFYKTT